MIKNPIEEKTSDPHFVQTKKKRLLKIFLPREPCDDDGEESFITPLSGIIFVMEDFVRREISTSRLFVVCNA